MPTRLDSDSPHNRIVARTQLRAGPLSLSFEGGDLRNVRLGAREILRRVYAAVRDRNWGTVAPVLSNLRIEQTADTFRIAYEMEHRRDEIDFQWFGTIEGGSDGTLAFSMDGLARATFLRSRIGFCLLHPAECAGSVCRIEHADGTESTERFPEFIEHAQPVPGFSAIRAMTQEVAPGVTARIELEGDLFETEDQRNWTDASYKTFCTPLRLPIPVEVPAGTRIRQTITLHLEGDLLAVAPAPTVDALTSGAAGSHTVRLKDRPALPLPTLGLGLPSLPAALSTAQIARLKALHPAHLRVDLRLASDDWKEFLERAVRDSASIGAPLEIAVLLPDEPTEAMERLRGQIESLRPRIARWLVLPAAEHLTRTPPHARLLAAAKSALGSIVPAALFAAGSNSDFIFVNRYPPPADAGDSLAFAINPQVHAFDNVSVMETLVVQNTVIQSARHLAGGKPIVVSPVTLLPRVNPYAPTTLPWSPPPPDPRQRTLFAAAWTIGSLKHLAEGGADSVTYYETVGAGGVLEEDRVFPNYHVLADVAEFAGGKVVPTTAGDPYAVASLLLRKEGRTRLLVGNLTPAAQHVRVEGLAGSSAVWLLDETNLREAADTPEAFRARNANALVGANLPLTLPPYAVARVDLDPERTLDDR